MNIEYIIMLYVLSSIMRILLIRIQNILKIMYAHSLNYSKSIVDKLLCNN